ncbi:lysozyme family protein [Enterococcus casseliflavus]|uniref:bifunctional lytic transglycosylase/C40 family peptidase n=1 Tax=Enterococcus casseliflavus TaxID=37734 RepID=UPI00115D1A04|nr:lysozyme family protein [Enterococcus casseliflavus]
MKIRHLVLVSSLLVVLFSFILLVTVLFADEEEVNSSSLSVGNFSLSSEVLAYRSIVEKYAKENGISEYVPYLLAIMQVESGGKGNDVMQSSESLGLPPNSLDSTASIKQGVKYFAALIQAMKERKCDINTAIQSYNYGGGFIGYVTNRGKKYSYELASDFAKEKSGGQKVTYTNPVVNQKGNWRYAYGNQYYVALVLQYIRQGNSQKFDDQTVQKIMDEALKYENFPYVFGGSTPTTSFDCSGLTQWCYAKVGITLPRTAQAQYDSSQHLLIKEAKPGDLVFFHSTYDAGTYVTHVGIYVGNMRMYNAGDPIGYADLNDTYWQLHLIGAGRVK